MAERYANLNMPVTIMAGTEDRIVDHEGHAKWFHEQIPDSDLRLVPGAGHMVHYAVPDQVAEAIRGGVGAGGSATACDPSGDERRVIPAGS